MKRKVLSVLVSLCLAFSMVPAMALTAFATEGAAGGTSGETTTPVYAPGEVGSWVELQEAINTRSNAKLVKDITCPADGSALTVPNKDFTLDLNGYTIDRGLAGKAAVENGYVIEKNYRGCLTIKDTSPLQTGKITGGNNTGDGGGIYNGGGYIILEGGAICGNSAVNGGGIYNSSNYKLGDTQAININGGTVCCNTATQDGGGVYCKNLNDPYAGGIAMNSGAVRDNAALRNGGGIWTGVRTAVYSGDICNNSACGKGGGLFSDYGTTKTDSSYQVHINLSAKEGEAVNIIGNRASQGGGVCLQETVNPVRSLYLDIRGKVIIRDNTDYAGTVPSNVCMYEDNDMTASSLHEDADVRVSTTGESFYFNDASVRANAPNSFDSYPQIKWEAAVSGSFPVVYFGAIASDNVSNPIAWYILPESNHSGGKARFLWSRDSVGYKSFENMSSGTAAHTWWDSEARDWLNVDFYNAAFSSQEKQGLLKTALSSVSQVGNYIGVAIDDYVFLLSAEELISSQYGFKNNLLSDDRDPAKAGVQFLMRSPYYVGTGPGYDDAVPGVISASGTFYANGINDAIGMDYNLRPGINLNQNTTLLLPATNGNEITPSNTLTQVSNAEGAFKLAMRITEMAGFEITNQISSGNSVTFTYAGAKTGTNHYITAAIVNENGDVKALASLARAIADSDDNADDRTLTVNLGNVVLGENDELLVFCSQENGDKRTNFVSNWVELDSVSVHAHNMKALKAATSCTAVGVSQDCWYCDGCELYFKDAAGTEELSNVQVDPAGHQWKSATCEEPPTCSVCKAKAGAALGHQMSDDYAAEKADAVKHYHACTVCGKAEDAGEAHEPNIDAPTATQAKVCNVCGYVMAKATGFVVSFDARSDGASEIDDQIVAPDGKAEKPKHEPTRAGYIFEGWYTSADGGTTLSDMAYDFNSPVTSDITLYAKWREKAVVSISQTPQNYTWDGSAKAFVVTGSDLNGFMVEYMVNGGWTSDAPSAAGSYDVKVTRAEDETYKAFETEIASGLVIDKAAAGLTVPALKTDLVYDGSGKNLISEGAVVGGTLHYAIGSSAEASGDAWSTEVPSATNAGAYHVWYKVVGDDNHAGVQADYLGVASIAPMKVSEPTVVGEYEYRAQAQTAELDGVENYMSVSGDVRTDAGSYVITVTLDANHEWSDGYDGNVEWVIKKAELSVTAWPSVNKTVYVNDESVSLTNGTADVDGEFKFGAVDLTTSGNKLMQVTFEPSDGANYESATSSVAVSVEKRIVKSVAEQSAISDKLYGTAQDKLGLPKEVTIAASGDKAFTVPVSWSGYVPERLEEQTLTGALDLSKIADEVVQPETPIKASIVVDLQERTAATFEYADKTAIYNGSAIAHEVPDELDGVKSVSYSYAGIGDTSYAATETAPTNVGTYQVTATFAMEPGYAVVSAKTAKLTIEPKEVGLTWTELSASDLIYSGTAKVVSAAATGLVEGELCDVAVQLVGDNVKVGTFTYKATGLSNANYKLPENVVSPNYVIAPKAVTVTVEDKEAYVGDELPEFTYTVDGLIAPDALVAAGVLATEADMTKAGEFAIEFATEPSAGGNYAITCVPGKLTVSHRPVPPSATEVTVPISGDENAIQVGASVAGGTATIDDVDLSRLDTVIGDEVSTGTVTIDFSGLDAEVDTVEIPADVIKQISDAVSDPTNDAESLEIVLSEGVSVEFDAVSLASKAEQADGADVTISVRPSKDANPNAAQQEAVGGRPAYDITVTSGGQHISDFGGTITVHAPYELKDGEHPRGIVVWYVDEEGKKHRCETSYDQAKKRVNWKTDHLSLYVIGYEEVPGYDECERDASCPVAGFADAKAGAWYHDGLHWAIDAGVLRGYTDGSNRIGPEDATTRAQLFAMLHRLEGEPEAASPSTFADVSAGAWYAGPVAWAQAEGLLRGYGDGSEAGPDDPLTREQLATVLFRYAQWKGIEVAAAADLAAFADADEVDVYAKDAMAWAVASGVIKGYDDGSNEIGPNDPAKRAQVATMLMRFKALL